MIKLVDMAKAQYAWYMISTHLLILPNTEVTQLDSQYNERYAISGPKGQSIDMHEFQITHDDTALFIVYDTVSVDLQSVKGPQKGWIWDSRFVEIDIETNDVLFEWRASEHFNFTDVNSKTTNSTGWTFSHAWDFFHIHSVEKDTRGNYLISALHTDHLTYLDGRSGDIIWRLGGNHTDFQDISSGKRASNFASPNDARFHDDGNTITLFDNTTPGDKINRGVILSVDQVQMTVDVHSEFRAYTHDGVTPESQPQSDGSVQLLPNGNVLVSYGRNAPAWTEYSDLGIPKCHSQFGPLSSYGKGNPTTYRVKKRPWTGLPDSTPDFELDGYEAAVSWNGATEVHQWVVEGAEVPLPRADSRSDESDSQAVSDTYFSAITKAKKTGFETIITIPFDAVQPYLRVRALDKKGLIIGTSAILPFNPTPADENPPSEEPPSESQPSLSLGHFFAGAGATIAILLCLTLFRRYCGAACLRSCRRIRLRRYGYLLAGRRGSESNWEEYVANEEQEVGLHIASDTDSDDSDEVEVSDLDNPRLSPAINRTPSWQSTMDSLDSGRPMLNRTPSALSSEASREKQS